MRHEGKSPGPWGTPIFRGQGAEKKISKGKWGEISEVREEPRESGVLEAERRVSGRIEWLLRQIRRGTKIDSWIWKCGGLWWSRQDKFLCGEGREQIRVGEDIEMSRVEFCCEGKQRKWGWWMKGRIGLRTELLLFIRSKFIHRNLVFRYRI